MDAIKEKFGLQTKNDYVKRFGTYNKSIKQLGKYNNPSKHLGSYNGARG